MARAGRIAARAVALWPLALAACTTARAPYLMMPVVGIETTRGRELGVATDDGIVFLARTADSGPAKVLFFLDEAPVIEPGEIHVAANGMARVDLEVPIASVPISLEPLTPGEPLLLIGLDGEMVFQLEVNAVAGGPIEGTAIDWPAGFEIRPEFVGAGVFRRGDEGIALVGLLKATATMDDGRRVLLLAGLPELRQMLSDPRRAVPVLDVRYRADGARTVRMKR